MKNEDNLSPEQLAVDSAKRLTTHCEHNDNPAFVTITEDDIPTGDSAEDRRARHDLIYSFYERWKRDNPEQKKYNIALKGDINIRAVSIDETARHASLKYLSTLAVLQLDAILTNAWLVKIVPSKADRKNQRSFERMLIMEYICTGVGRVKMTVGVRRKDRTRVQYCITAIEAGKTVY